MNTQKEIEKIRDSYNIKQRTKTGLQELKELDKKVKRPAKIFSYTYGIIGSLVLGVGMCLAMGVIGSSVPLGIIIGIAGIGMVSSTNFIHNKLLNSRKDKYRDQILEKSNSLIQEPTIEEYRSSQKTTEKISVQFVGNNKKQNFMQDKSRE